MQEATLGASALRLMVLPVLVRTCQCIPADGILFPTVVCDLISSVPVEFPSEMVRGPGKWYLHMSSPTS